MDKLNILFLCTGNSCRSQIAESIVNSQYSQKFRAFSAGSNPDLDKFPGTDGVHPMALRILGDNRMQIDRLHAKSWDSFIQQKEAIHFAFTLCDNAQQDIAEACPVFPGQPMTAHWGLDDPAQASGSDEEVYRVFQNAFFLIRRRIELFSCLPFEKLKNHALQDKLDEIGRS